MSLMRELPEGYEYSPRGFVIGPSIEGTPGYPGYAIAAWESSLATQACIWVGVSAQVGDSPVSVHLTLDAAKALAASINEICRLHRMADR